MSPLLLLLLLAAPPPSTADPIDQAMLRDLVLLPRNRELRPGSTLQMYVACPATLGWWSACPYPVAWSVSPGGARIGEDGILHVGAGTKHGTTYIVGADVGPGQRRLEVEVRVYSVVENPLLGAWSEEVQLDCTTGTSTVPPRRIQAVLFEGGGAFRVTWEPFEAYHDYWGRYEYDRTSRRLRLRVQGSNYLPPDLDGRGRAWVDEEGRLVLEEMWLGTPQPHTGDPLAPRPAASPPPAPPRCGHRLRREEP